MSAAVQRLWPGLPLALGLAALVLVVNAGADEVLQRVLVAMLVNVVMVVAIYVFAGNSGIISFGHMAFVLIGAYTAGLLTLPQNAKRLFLPDLPALLADAHVGMWTAVLIAGAVSGVFGAIVSLPVMRLSGIQAAIATFAVLVIVQVVALNLEPITGGQNSLVGVPVELTVAIALVWAGAALVVATLYQNSRRGRCLRASREDQDAASSLGIRVALERRIAFTLSAVLAGIAGGLFSQYAGVFSPSSFYLPLTFLTLVMLVFGGIASLSGAVVGTVVISALTELLRQLEIGVSAGGSTIRVPEGTTDLGLAGVLLVVLLLLPRGITGGRELPLPWRRRTVSSDERKESWQPG